jgi:hypothetical protein
VLAPAFVVFAPCGTLFEVIFAALCFVPCGYLIKLMVGIVGKLEELLIQHILKRPVAGQPSLIYTIVGILEAYCVDMMSMATFIRRHLSRCGYSRVKHVWLGVYDGRRRLREMMSLQYLNHVRPPPEASLRHVRW